MIAAPTPRAGQIAPNRCAESWRLSRTIRGHEPTGAQMWVSVPFSSDPRFVLKPNLDRRAGGAAEQSFLQSRAKVFLKASSALGSFFGWIGRGCSRVRFSWCSHLPTVLWCTCTEKRRPISSLQVSQSPPHDVMALRSGALNDQCFQFRLLCIRQRGLAAGATARLQSIYPAVVITMHPIAQSFEHERAKRRVSGGF